MLDKLDVLEFIKGDDDAYIMVQRPFYFDKIKKVYKSLGEPYSSYADKLNTRDWFKNREYTLLDKKLNSYNFIMYFVGLKIRDSEGYNWDEYLTNLQNTQNGDISNKESPDNSNSPDSDSLER